MKKFICYSLCLFILLSCKEKVKEGGESVQKEEIPEKVTYASFGKEIIADDAIRATSMAAHYSIMQVGDSINSKMFAKVTGVCKAKGCWMTLDMEDGTEAMVKFKDYGFFVPKDIEGRDVIVNGKAYVKEISIEEQKHYAMDAGKSEAEIASIVKPKRTFSFEADGVLLKE